MSGTGPASVPGVFLGKSSCPAWRGAGLGIWGAPVCATPESHTLIVAPTRSGKGTRVIIPTLLRYAGSALVLDPKGENAAVTASTRRDDLEQDVHIVNPWSEWEQVFTARGFSPAVYNPLDIVDRNDPNAASIALSLADAICPSSHDGKDRFWEGSAGGVLSAVFLWLADQPGEKKTLARAREIVTLSKPEFTANYLPKMAASRAFDGAIREMTAPLIGMAQDTYSGIMAALAQDTRWLSDGRIKAATASSSFSMADLVKKKTTVYLVVPFAQLDTQKTWLRLMIAAAMQTFKASNVNERPPGQQVSVLDR